MIREWRREWRVWRSNRRLERELQEQMASCHGHTHSNLFGRCRNGLTGLDYYRLCQLELLRMNTGESDG